MSSYVRLSHQHAGGETDVVVDVSTGAPTIVYWGGFLGADVDLASVAAANDRPLAPGMSDAIAPISVVPEHGSGFVGRPGLTGRRRGVVPGLLGSPPRRTRSPAIG